MKARTLWTMLCLWMASMMTTVSAQSAVSAGKQVTSEDAIVSGNTYVLKTGAGAYVTDAGTFYSVPNNANSATEASVYYLISNGDGTWKIKCLYTEKYWGVPKYNAALAPAAESAAGAWSLNFSDGVAYPTAPDANGTTRGIDRSDGKVWGWNTGTNNNHKVYIYEVLVDTWKPTASEVYTLSHANRGSVIYHPNLDATHVWSSGKSGAFNPNNANSQWVFYPTGADGEYYLYNVGAGKFAIPSGMASGAAYPWVFSNNAVALTPILQDDGTYKIRAVTDPVSGSNGAYLSSSNEKTYPIINYNDNGSCYTITKVADASVELSTQLSTAVGRLVGRKTALTAQPTKTGWYVLQIQTAASASHVGRYVKTAASEFVFNGTSYPLTFEGGVNLQPTISESVYYTRIVVADGSNQWQMPNGRYLVGSANKFPLSSETAVNMVAGYDKGNYFKSGTSQYYAVPFVSNGTAFIGESSAYRTFYVYPIDMEETGLEPWQVVCDDAPESAGIHCLRNDVNGLTTVYKNGYFFLPKDVTPEPADFQLDGAIKVEVNAETHTIVLTYDPNLAMVAAGVNVKRGYQTAGRGNENTLLQCITITPFKDATNVRLNVKLSAEAAACISSLYVYENSNMEFIATEQGEPLAVTNEVGEETQLNIGALTTGKHVYWLCATIKEDAKLETMLSNALKSIVYDCNENTTTLELGEAGNPSRQAPKVFQMQRFVFRPTIDNCRYYRIPAMILDKNGNIVAAIDKRYNSNSDLGYHKIDVVSVRSEDGGRTWSAPATVALGDGSSSTAYGYGDAALTLAPNGNIICIMAAGSKMYGSGQVNAGISISEDNGQTWSTVRSLYSKNFTDEVNSLENAMGFTNQFMTSGKGLTTADGTIMYTTNSRLTGDNTNYIYILKSTDNGNSWTIGADRAYSGGDESKLVQMNDGSLLLSVRQSGNRGWNKGASDGTGWGTQYRTGDIWGNACNADILYYSRSTENAPDILLHSYINSSGRESLQLSMSIDEGQTWQQVYNIQPNGSCYSTMQRLPDGTLAILYEDESYSAGNGYAINYLTITQEQILDWYVKIGGVIDGVQGIAAQPAAQHHGIFDLSGRRVERPTKGLYIIDGQKTVIR